MSVAVMTQTRTHQQAFGGGNIKKQLRDTQRLLSRPTLPADVRREQERKLAALQLQFVEHEKTEKEKKMVTAYRMVRFFERKKAERHLKQALKYDDDVAKEVAIMDLNYIIHFPKDRKYISLFPTSETTDDRVLEERRNIRDRVNKELMAKANVESILEAPLPVMERASELEGAEFTAKQTLAPAHKDSEDDEDDDDEEDGSEDDESEEDGSEDDSGDDDSDDLDSEDDDNSGFDSEDDDSEEEDSDDSEDDDENEDSEDEDNEDESDDDESDEEDDESDDFDEEDDASDASGAPSPKRTRQ